MAENGISTLATKAERQIAKLELAQTKRQLVGTAGYRELRYYDANLLPARYQENDTVFTPHPDGLQPGRPWKTTPNVLSGLWRSQYTGYFNGDWTWFDTQTPTASIQVNDFTFPDGVCSYQWLGYFKAPHTANYTFYLTSDDRAQFWLGDKAITGYTDGNWDVFSDAGTGEQITDPIALTAGQYYPIRLQYGDAGGTSILNFSWSDDFGFPTYESVDLAGSTINTEQTALFKLTIRSSSFDVDPVVNGQISINDILTVDTSSRGHTVLAMHPNGTVLAQLTFDTWGQEQATAAMSAALQSYPTGTVIAICSYDACSLDTTVRATLNTYYGGTLTDTWIPNRYSHIFIGTRI